MPERTKNYFAGSGNGTNVAVRLYGLYGRVPCDTPIIDDDCLTRGIQIFGAFIEI